MRKIWRIFLQDARNATRNPIALVVCVGLVIIPSLYAWFNIAGGWDPYGNTRELKVAVANCDEGYTSSHLPMRLDLGEDVAQKLRQNEKIGYTITSREDAEEGVRSGKYYAAIIIPEDFTRSLLSVASADVHPATLVYETNEKENAIAPIVTDKAVTAVQSDIQETFAQTVGEVGAGALASLQDYLSDDEVLSLAGSLDKSLGDGATDLRTVASHVDAYSKLVSSAAGIVESSDSLLQTSGDVTGSATDALTTSATSIREMGQAMDGAADAIDSALATSSQSLDSVDAAVDQAFDAAATSAGHSSGELRDVASKVDGVRASYEELEDGLREVRDLLEPVGRRLLDPAIAQVRAVETRLATLRDHLNTAADNIDRGVSDVASDRAAAHTLVSEGRREISSLQSTYRNDVSGTVSKLADKVDDAAASSSEVGDLLDSTVSDLRETSTMATDDLRNVQATLDDVSGQVSSTADDIDELRESLEAALASKDAAQVRTILSAGPEALAKFISSPVTVDRQAVYPIENNGSAMAGFYTTLSLWVGAIVLVAMMRVDVSDAEAERAGGAAPRHRYLGRLGVYLVLGVLQATLCALGDLFYLGIQCVDPWGFLVTCWISSIVFVNIMYAFTVSFGDVGKAICVFLLVIQVAGSGGTFPKEMLPAGFQAAYPYLPFVHSIAAMHECIGGYYGTTWVAAQGALLGFLAGSLVLGLALRKPVVRLNRWIIEKLEDTRIM